MADRDEALEYHARKPVGKISVEATKPCLTQRDLSLAYSPGVAEPCREIFKDPEKVFDYTAKGNLVAVVSNGTAVLGLGNIGPAAGKPVMEGKGVLFKRFAGIDVFDIELDAPDVETFCQVVRAMAPTFGGINIEDVKAPDCFLIEERLSAELDIPVFHDDQHGTAIISCAGMVNGLMLAGKRLEDARIVFSGAGAASLATAKLLQCLGVPQTNILMVDSRGVIRKGDPRLEGNPYKQRYAADTDRETLADAMRDADVFVGCSVAGLVTPEMVASMAPTPLVFALANPDPEIPYEDAKAVRPDAIVATGRSDYPNQVNNVLGFPYIFRGALDVRARVVNEAMMIAAVNAIAELAREEVDDSVYKAYGGKQLRFGPEYIIPKPFDPRVLLRVAPAVAKAATFSGVARKPLGDVEEYRTGLERFLGKEREVMRFAITRARHHPTEVVFAEGGHDTVLRAAAQLVDEDITRPILVGAEQHIRNRIEELELDLGLDDGRATLVDPATSPLRDKYRELLFQRRCRKGMSMESASRALDNSVWFAAMMVQEGQGDGLVAGLEGTFPDTLRPALRVIGTGDDQKVHGVHLMVMRDDIYFFADTTITLDPTAEEMANIACLTADLARSFGVEPRVGMISFSNFGSVRHPRSEKVRRATELVRQWRPELEVDGEIHADVALFVDESRARFPFLDLSARANVLVFPSLEGGNIAQKVAHFAGAQAAIGPILVGLSRPANVVSPLSGVSDVVLSAAITAMMAADRRRSRAAELDATAATKLVERAVGVTAKRR